MLPPGVVPFVELQAATTNEVRPIAIEASVLNRSLCAEDLVTFQSSFKLSYLVPRRCFFQSGHATLLKISEGKC